MLVQSDAWSRDDWFSFLLGGRLDERSVPAPSPTPALWAENSGFLSEPVKEVRDSVQVTWGALESSSCGLTPGSKTY